MSRSLLLGAALLAAAPACGLLPASIPASATPERLSLDAARHDALITVPEFESTPAEVVQTVEDTLAVTDAALEQYAAQDPASATFASAIAARDDIFYPVVTLLNRIELMQETQPRAEMRDAARAANKRIVEWFISTGYREDLYAVADAFRTAYEAGERGTLQGEDLELYEEVMRDYRRDGFELDAATRAEVETLQKRLADLSTQFDKNITDASVVLSFTKDELEGLSDDMLERYVQSDGSYALKATVTSDFIACMHNARREETRKRMKVARYTAAAEGNLPLLDQIVAVRAQIAQKLGYATWADYRTEVKMAGSGDNALEFVRDLAQGLQPKFDAELETLRQLKVADTGDPDAQIHIWDWRYYQRRLMEREYDIDTEVLREYFPLEACIDGMYGVFSELFGLEFVPVEGDPGAWSEGVELTAVYDSASGEPMGMFYFDKFPREGKYNHFAQFGIIPGKQLDDDVYQRPTVALVCNFTPPVGDKPSLITHDELETLFHEFGHALHSILTRAHYSSFSGTAVPRDFVEAPSQMLEAWIWDTEILDGFAGHYLDPSKKIDGSVLERMEAARLATVAVTYRRQLALGLGDLRLHVRNDVTDADAVVDSAFADVFLPVPDDTGFAAYFGHLTGYDAGYYGYAWADAISADMASVFERAPGGLMDKQIGMRLRDEVYATGGSRDVSESIRAFLGRERSLEPFLAKIGIETEGDADS